MLVLQTAMKVYIHFSLIKQIYINIKLEEKKIYILPSEEDNLKALHSQTTLKFTLTNDNGQWICNWSGIHILNSLCWPKKHYRKLLCDGVGWSVNG